jgi:2-C-methyl-D-erythritol 4-phosphate cytidylyltransferase
MIQKSYAFSTPGVTKQKSILNGLKDIATVASDIDTVVVMDAARPNITDALISECIKRSDGHDGAVPTIPVDDSILISDDGKKIKMVVPRSRMYQSQTPVAFNLGKYYRANIALINKTTGTDINSAVEPAIKYGMDIAMFPGTSKNYKITSVNDLNRFIDSTERDKAAKGNQVHIYKLNGG